MFNHVNRIKFFVVIVVLKTVQSSGHQKLSTVKYILQWTNVNAEPPLVFMPTGHQPFTNCLWDNCYLTRSKHYFNDLTLFDAILFHAPDFMFIDEIPTQRHPRQKYVFVSQEPASIYPLPPEDPANFFNVTWTYKLDSDISFRFVMVKNRYGDEIGPRKSMQWINTADMLPTDDFVKSRLQKKSKAVAWIQKDCASLNYRDFYVVELLYELSKLGLSIDIYGECTPASIKMKFEDALKLLEHDYYFYLAFEKAFDEDYVSETLLYALQHYTVPIVYGGANYSRFLPDGVYLNAREFSPDRLAKQINELIEDKEMYYEYFKWRGYYNFFNPEELKGESEYCKFCEFLNDEAKMLEPVTYLNLADWWNRPSMYRPKLHSPNYTDFPSFSRRFSKDTLGKKPKSDIETINENDYPDSQQLRIETLIPRISKQSKINSKMKTPKAKRKKMQKNSPINKSIKSRRKLSGNNRSAVILDVEKHDHTHRVHEHDNHEHEDHEPMRSKADRVLEWHYDLPEPMRSIYGPKKTEKVLADGRHLNFFFDVPTITTGATTVAERRYVTEKGLLVSALTAEMCGVTFY